MSVNQLRICLLEPLKGILALVKSPLGNLPFASEHWYFPLQKNLGTLHYASTWLCRRLPQLASLECFREDPTHQYPFRQWAPSPRPGARAEVLLACCSLEPDLARMANLILQWDKDHHGCRYPPRNVS